MLGDDIRDGMKMEMRWKVVRKPKTERKSIERRVEEVWDEMGKKSPHLKMIWQSSRGCPRQI